MYTSLQYLVISEELRLIVKPIQIDQTIHLENLLAARPTVKLIQLEWGLCLLFRYRFSQYGCSRSQTLQNLMNFPTNVCTSELQT